MKRVIILFILIIFCSKAFANQASETGKVTFIRVHNDPISHTTSERVRIHLSGEIQNAYCPDGNWVINLSNESAKAQYSLILAAFMSGKEVTLLGNTTETCIGNMEVIRNADIAS